MNNMKKALLGASIWLALISPSQATADDYAAYSFAMYAGQANAAQHHAVSVESNEYWQDVSGQQLKQGIELPVSSASPVVLITPKHEQTGAELNVDALSLRIPGEALERISQRVAADKLAQTGIFSKAVALHTRLPKAQGKLKLQSEQDLSPGTMYRVMVKERESATVMQLTAPDQNVAKGLTVSAKMQHGGRNLEARQVKANLLTPDGLTILVHTTIVGDEVEFDLKPVANAIPPRKGLYELHVDMQAENAGQPVKRSAKLAVAMHQNTASIQTVEQRPGELDAQVHFTASQASRFEVRALLFASDKRGNLHPLMESHAAQSFEPGDNVLKITFDPAILAESGLRAPFELRQVQLHDQHQLAIVDSWQSN